MLGVVLMLVVSMLVVSMLVCWWCRGCVTCLKLSPNLRKVSKLAEDKQKVEDLEVCNSISWFVCKSSFTTWHWFATVSTFVYAVVCFEVLWVHSFALWKAWLILCIVHGTRSRSRPQQQLNLPSASCHSFALCNVQHIQRMHWVCCAINLVQKSMSHKKDAKLCHADSQAE